MLAEHALYQLSYDPLIFGRQKYKKNGFSHPKNHGYDQNLFVCHENICRSPMAEFVLKTLATEPFSPNGLIRERDCLPYT